MKELREQIAEIIYADMGEIPCSGWEYLNKDHYYNLANKILSLPIPNLWVEKKCPECLGKPEDGPRCIICNHTGIIRRPATWADVDIKSLLEDVPCGFPDCNKFPTTPDGGKLVWDGK